MSSLSYECLDEDKSAVPDTTCSFCDPNNIYIRVFIGEKYDISWNYTNIIAEESYAHCQPKYHPGYNSYSCGHQISVMKSSLLIWIKQSGATVSIIFIPSLNFFVPFHYVIDFLSVVFSTGMDKVLCLHCLYRN